MDQGSMGQVGQQSPRALLLAHSPRPQTAHDRDDTLEPSRSIHRPCTRARAHAGDRLMLRRSQRDFEDEIKSHMQLEIDRLKAQGMSDHDAQLAAHKHFGSLTVAEDRYYHAQRFSSFDDVMRDVRHAMRGLMRTPAFLVTAVVTLALAMGAVAGMFDVVNTVMLRPLPFPAADRLMFLTATAPGTDVADTVGLG